MYRNAKNEILRLDKKTKIPAMYDGTVVRILDDFLGKSVMIEHSLPDNGKLCTIFAHTVPHQDVRTGMKVSEDTMSSQEKNLEDGQGGPSRMRRECRALSAFLGDCVEFVMNRASMP